MPSGCHPDAPKSPSRAMSFGYAARLYAAHRPGYPEAAVRWALQPLAGRSRPHVVDLGAGTGKLTQALVRLGVRVTAVEPDQRMIAELRRTLPGVPALAGTAERLPLRAATADAVLVGDAFHWFDADEALDRIARVLKPGGVLATLWNADDNRVAWVAGFDLLYGSHVGLTDHSTPPLPAHPAFTCIAAAQFPHTVPHTADTLTARVATHSYVAARPPGERAALLDAVRRYLASTPQTARGVFEFPHVTLAERCLRGGR